MHLQHQAGAQRKLAGPGSPKRAIIPSCRGRQGARAGELASEGHRDSRDRRVGRAQPWRPQGSLNQGPPGHNQQVEAGILGSGAREEMFEPRFCCSAILHRANANPSVWAHPSYLQILPQSLSAPEINISVSSPRPASRFSYHNASNRACIFLSPHLSVLTREAGVSWRVGQGLRGALLGYLCSQRSVCGCERVHVHACTWAN